MGARISIDASEFVEQRETTRHRVRGHAAVAGPERARDFKGVALGVGVGGVLWLVLASVARLMG